jgi:hypothetical protein
MLREAALVLFLVAVALGLWLADLRPLVVVLVMALALAVAWVIEWVSWREDHLLGIRLVQEEVRTTEVVAESPPPPAPAPRARGLWLRRRPRRRSEPSEEAEAAPTPPDLETPAEPEVETEQPASEAASPAEPPHAEQPAPPEPSSQEPPPSKRRLKHAQSAPPPPPPPPEPEPSLPPPEPEPQGAPVVPLWARSSQPREWNLWDLERIARAQSRRDPERFEEWSYLFFHLRRFANADGMLPAEFDGLVRDSFGGLLEPAQGA